MDRIGDDVRWAGGWSLDKSTGRIRVWEDGGEQFRGWRLNRMRWRVGLRAATVLKQDNECMVAVGDLRLGLGQ